MGLTATLRSKLWGQAKYIEKVGSLRPKVQAEFTKYYGARYAKAQNVDVIDYGYKIYKQAAENNLESMVLGRGRLFDDLTLVGNFGLSSNTPMNKAGKVIHPDLLSSGSVIGEAFWTPFLNDSFITGGAHSGSVAYTTAPSIDDLIANSWDDKNLRPTVLGRELTILDMLGYLPTDLRYASSMGVTLAPPQLVDLEAGLEDFDTAISGLNKDEMERLIERLGRRGRW